MSTPIPPASQAGLTPRLAGIRERAAGLPAPTPGPSRTADRATLSNAGRQLGELSTLLGRLRSAFAEAGRTGIRRNQASIDFVRERLTQLGDARAQGGLASKIVSPEVRSAEFFNVDLAEGERAEVNVEVLQSAQRGSLFLSTQGFEPLSLGGSSLVITLEITGNLGSKSLDFTSSQTISQIAATINAFAHVTGVEAERIETSSGYVGVALRSASYGSGEFVSVSKVGPPSSNLTIRGADPADSDRPFGPEASVSGTVTDPGQDVRANVNGRPAGSYGTQIAFLEQRFGGILDLTAGPVSAYGGANATNPGSFLAAILNGSPGLATNPVGV